MSEAAVDKLIFVYNADSSLLASVVDATRKVLRINNCALCDITHGLLGEKEEWATCRSGLGVPVEVLHRDEMSDDLRDLIGDRLPCVVAESERGCTVLLPPDAIERCRGSVEDLRGKLSFHAARKGLRLSLSRAS